MISLPIPIFGAIVLFFLFMRTWISRGSINLLTVIIAICAIQSLIIALAQHYQLPSMRLLQPVTATIIPAFAWFAFQATAVRSAQLSDLLHILVPIPAIAALLFAPAFLDIYIPAVFVVYAALIIIQCLKGPDAHPRTYLSSGELPSKIWLWVAAFLLISAFSDVLIAVSHSYGFADWQPWIISVFSVCNLIAIGMLSLSGHLDVENALINETIVMPTESETEVLKTVQKYMTEHQLFLDPDLTLAKLSRKVKIPAKTISTAINRTTGENVSRFVNKARIEAAKTMMLEGQNVTNAMLLSGFNTKSNFNREFLRVTGTSPQKWLAAEKVR